MTTDTSETPTYVDEWEDDDPNDEERACWYCHGDGWGIVGLDWDEIEPFWGPGEGEVETCPNCHGSGLAKDCTFW